MLKEVIKRNGRHTKFIANKINIAIQKANNEVSTLDQASDEEIDRIVKDIKSVKDECIHIEVVQDLVETGLMKAGRFELAKKYMLYRYKHKLARDLSEAEASVLGILDGTNLGVIDENSNKNSYVNSTQRDLMAGEVSRTIAKKILLPDDIRKADEDMEIHWHDIDYTVQSMVNCCLINVKSILDFGTVMNDYLIVSPKSFRTACNIITQVVAIIASNQYGGQSVNIRHLGRFLAISRERFRVQNQKQWDSVGLSYTEEQLNGVVEQQLRYELEQGVQTIQYQLNTLVTTNGQAPFVTLFLELRDDDPYENEVALIIEEILKQRLQGVMNSDGVYVTPSFPKLIYVVDEHNCLRGGKYDYLTHLAAKCTIKRSYPDYISAKKMREQFDGEVFSCMGCRSFLSPWKKTEWYVKMMNEPDSEIGNYLWEGRFNQGVVTINLPQIGIIADHDMDTFWSLLDERLAKCYKALLLRHKLLEGTKASTSPLHWQFGGISRLNGDDTIDILLHDGFSTLSLGYIGIYETVYAMLGVSHTTPEGKEFALKIMHRLAGACETWKKETNLGFGLYGTPRQTWAA